MCARRDLTGFLAGSVRITRSMLPAGARRVVVAADELGVIGVA
jgi:hypothetical protein